MQEIQIQKQLFSGVTNNANEAETLINLRKATDRLGDLMNENERLKRDRNIEVTDLKNKLKEAEIKRDAFEEEMTFYQN